jgi:hypothetical protein
MTKPTTQTLQRPGPKRPAGPRPAPKTPVTKEAVRRVQSGTAVKNGGKQGDWTRRMQSTLDRQQAQDADGEGARSAPGQPDQRGAGGKKHG